MKDAKTIVPLIITGIDILIYLAPIIILLPLLMLISSLDGGIPAFLTILVFVILFFADMILMCLAPISQLVLAIVAIVNRKLWLLLIHIPFIALTAGVCYVFYDWIGHIT
ncbi:MAG: hypothetical protein E7292_05765 [Lachnospiraceae bacterium]|nr:hypothetical protein [Lachnospiraceae bacterium]